MLAYPIGSSSSGGSENISLVERVPVPGLQLPRSPCI